MDTEAPQNKDFENQSKAPVSPQEDADDVNSVPISNKKDSDTLVNVSVKKVPDKKNSATASVDKVSPKADSGSTNKLAVDPVPLQNHTNIPKSAPGNKATDSSQQLHGIAKAVKSQELSVEGTPASANAPAKSPQPSTSDGPGPTSVPPDTSRVVKMAQKPLITIPNVAPSPAAEDVVSIPDSVMSPPPVPETLKHPAEPALSEGAFVPNYEELSEAGSEAPKPVKTLPPTLTLDRDMCTNL